MNATVDADLAKVVQQHVCQLSSDLEKMNFETEEEMNDLKEELKKFQLVLQELEKRVVKIEEKHDILQQEQNSTSSKVDAVEQRVIKLEDQKYTCIPQETSYCKFFTLFQLKCIFVKTGNRRCFMFSQQTLKLKVFSS